MAIVQRELQLPLTKRRQLSRRTTHRFGQLGPVMTLALLCAALWLSYSVIGFALNMAQVKLNDLRFGYPRTFQTDGYIGYREGSGLPTHFTVLNAHRQVLIMIVPGTDPGHVTVIKGPYLLGTDQEFNPATIEITDVNHDGFADIVLHVAGQTVTYLNDPHKQTFVVPQTAGGAHR